MITPELIQRINFLARKQRSEGLTEAEQKEQEQLRRTYIEAIKKQVRASLDNIKPQQEHCSSDCNCYKHH